MTVYCLKRLLSALVILGSIAISTRAAEIRCVDYWPNVPQPTALKYWPSGRKPTAGSSCFESSLVGQIARGDYQKIVNLFATNQPFLGSIRLNSPGGDVDEAIRIGRLLRQYLMSAWAPIRFEGSPNFLWKVCTGESCICASACALIWFGAVQRNGSVGLHRPHIDDQKFKAMLPAEASSVYRKMLNSVTNYMEEMEAPKRMIETMVATGSAEIEWVNSDKDGLERPPSIAEWIDASCGSLTLEENDTYLTLMGAIAAKKQITREQQLLYKVLQERDQKKSTCTATLLSSTRDKLSLPDHVN